MSLVITDTPQAFQPVYSDGLYFTISADTTNTFKFRYVYDLYVEGNLVFQGRMSLLSTAFSLIYTLEPGKATIIYICRFHQSGVWTILLSNTAMLHIWSHISFKSPDV